MRALPTPLHLVVSIGPFSKWGMNFITCNPTSSDRHKYIVVAVDYFMKWAEAIPTFWLMEKPPLYSYSIRSYVTLVYPTRLLQTMVPIFRTI